MSAEDRKRGCSTDSEVAAFMSEFAKFLISAGINNRRFAAIARLAYFQAAAAQARFGNERLNQSAVAAMTGLTRPQVRRFAKQTPAALPSPSDRVERVVEGWSTDPAFSTSRLTPRRLRMSGRGQTFGALARKYGGDLTPRSLLRELERHGYVTMRDGYLSLKRVATRGREECRLRLITKALTELISAPGDQKALRAPMRAVNLEITYPGSSEKGRLFLQKRAQEGLVNFLQGLQVVGTATAIESPPSKGGDKRSTRARLVLITEDLGS